MEHTPLHETKIHGTLAFPYSVYRGSLPKWFSSFPLHWHDEFELITCTAGQIQVTLWGQTHTLLAGDLVVVLPRAVHSIEQSGSAQGEYYNILFHPSLFQGAGDDPCYRKYVLPFLEGQRGMDCFQRAGSPFNRDVAPCIQSLLDHRADSYTTHELLIKGSLFLILHHMTRHSTGTDGGDAQHLAYSRLKNALYYVQKFYDQDITVQRAAEQCGFSNSHFMKLFKQLTGMSFNAYLVNYRLELAAKQLSETELKVIDIAENCGFRNQSYFNRAFRKKFRKTPLAYRADSARKSAAPAEEEASAEIREKGLT